MDLSPVEEHNGMLYKREDLYTDMIYGVNGSKYRSCRYLISNAMETQGIDHVISAASVSAPRLAIAAVLAQEYGLKCTVIVGGTTPGKALRHKSIQIATAAGAEVHAIPVAYNTALQSASRRMAEERAGSWCLPYGIPGPPALAGFLAVGAEQTTNLPRTVETLVLPLGSGNTASGVLHGLREFHNLHPNLRHVKLMVIGPAKTPMEALTVSAAGKPLVPDGVTLEIIPLHPHWAEYGDKMPETLDGIVMHPTYEGKIVRYLNLTAPEWWTRRDGTTCLWIVGGPL